MDYQPEACTTAGGRYFLRDPTWIIGGTSTEQNRAIETNADPQHWSYEMSGLNLYTEAGRNSAI